MATKDNSKATIREVYTLHETTRQEMKEEFNKLDRKIDALALTFALKQDVDTITQDVTVIKARINTLERWKWYTTGAIMLAIFLVNIFLTDIKSLLFNH